MIRRRPVVVRRGPGLLGTVARTAVVAGTATVVSKGVNNAMNRSAQGQASLEQERIEAAAQQAVAQQMPPTGYPPQAAYPPAAAYPPQPAYAPAPEYVAEPAPAAPDPTDRIAQLKQLGELKEAGVLTEEEFQQEKQRILTGS